MKTARVQTAMKAYKSKAAALKKPPAIKPKEILGKALAGMKKKRK